MIVTNEKTGERYAEFEAGDERVLIHFTHMSGVFKVRRFTKLSQLITEYDIVAPTLDAAESQAIMVTHERPVTGVISVHSPAWVWDEIYAGDAIDTNYQDWYNDQEDEDAECPDMDGENVHLIGFTECEKDDAWWGSEGTVRQQFWKPDKSAEYAAIVRWDVIQVVWSNFAVRANPCSPCYPGQADLDNAFSKATYKEGKGLLAFSLPPDMFDKDQTDYPVDLITKMGEKRIAHYAKEMDL